MISAEDKHVDFRLLVEAAGFVRMELVCIMIFSWNQLFYTYIHKRKYIRQYLGKRRDISRSRDHIRLCCQRLVGALLVGARSNKSQLG